MTVKSGCINIIKEENMTSHDVVAIVRRVLGTKKVGHCGTLDPMAVGVLPIFVERATKFIEYTEGDEKVYKAGVVTGYISDTLDIWGKVEEGVKTQTPLCKETLEGVLNNFLGEIEQVPPLYSAIKVKGKKLYEYAREGKDVEIKPRKVFIYDIHLDSVEEDRFFITVRCSKGTYIRSLCRDIGKALGCDAIMCQLRRVKSGNFAIEDGISIEEFRNLERDKAFDYIKPIDYALESLEKITLKEEDKPLKQFLNGMRVSPVNYKIVSKTIGDKDSKFNNLYIVSSNISGYNQLIGVGHIEDNGSLKADKLLYLGDR